MSYRHFILLALAGLILSWMNLGGQEPPASATSKADRHGDPLPRGAVARMGSARFRHGAYGLRGLAFLPDGKSLVAATEEHSILFWEPNTGRLQRTIRTSDLWIRGLALSADGKLLAVAGFRHVEGGAPRGLIQILDTDSEKQVRTLERDARDVDYAALAFTPDGKLLLSLGGNGILRIEELATGIEILQQRFPADIMSNLALSRDGSTVAVASGPNTRKLFIWKWQTGEEPRELKLVPNARNERVAISPDGKTLAVCEQSDRPVQLWDMESGRLAHELPSPDAGGYWQGGLAFSPDGSVLAVSGGTRNHRAVIHLWNYKTREHQGRLEDGGGILAISADSRLLAAQSGNGVRVWDLASRKERGPSDSWHRGHIGALAVVQGLVLTASDDHSVRAWDWKTAEPKYQVAHDNWVRSVAASPDGKLAASSGLDDWVRVWDLPDGRLLYKLPGHGRLGGRRSLRFTPDGKRLLCFGDDFYLRAWEMRNGKAAFEHAIRPSGVDIPDPDAEVEKSMFLLGMGDSVFSPDGKLLVLNVGPQLHVFDVATGKEVRTIPNEGTHVVSLTVSPDSKYLLASAWGKQIQTKLPDGRVNYSSARNHPVCLWDLASGKLERQVLLSEGGVGPVAFSPDGRTFALGVAQPRDRITIYEVATAQERLTFDELPSRATCLAFTGDGRHLVSGMSDTTVLVWDLTALPKKRD